MMESNVELIAALEDDNMFGLEAPPEATGWTAAQIVTFFESDGEQCPPKVACSPPPAPAPAPAPAPVEVVLLCDQCQQGTMPRPVRS